jgi:hypothetical protein
MNWNLIKKPTESGEPPSVPTVTEEDATLMKFEVALFVATEKEACAVPVEKEASAVPTEVVASVVAMEEEAPAVPVEKEASAVPTEVVASVVAMEPAAAIEKEASAVLVEKEVPAVPVEKEAPVVAMKEVAPVVGAEPAQTLTPPGGNSFARTQADENTECTCTLCGLKKGISSYSKNQWNLGTKVYGNNGTAKCIGMRSRGR